MRELFYITCDSWWDTDITILPTLINDYDVEVSCLSYHNKSLNKYPQKSVPEVIKFHDFWFERSKKDIRTIICSVFYGFYLGIKTRNKVTIWNLDNNIWSFFFLVLIASRKKMIISMHNYVSHTDARGFEKSIKALALKKFKYFHFHSPMQEILFRRDFPQKISFSTEMPVKDYGAPRGKISYFNNSKRTFLFFGKVRDYKRPDLFIEASNELFSCANFILAGYSNNPQKYLSMIKTDNSIVCVFRQIENEEIPGLFANADFLVLPYEDSTQSGPLLIAYNYNLPIIASSLPYFEKMIDDGKTGFIFKQGHTQSLVDAINKAVNMSDDDYSFMKDSMRKRVEQYKKDTSFVAALNSFLDRLNN